MDNDPPVPQKIPWPPQNQDEDPPIEPPSEALQTALGKYTELVHVYNQCAIKVIDVHRSGKPALAALLEHEQDTKLDLKTIDLDKLQSLDDYKQWFELEKAESAERVHQNKQMRNLIKCADDMVDMEKSIRKELAAELADKAMFLMVWQFEKQTEEVAMCKTNFIQACRATVQRIKMESRG